MKRTDENGESLHRHINTSYRFEVYGVVNREKKQNALQIQMISESSTYIKIINT